MTEYGLLAGLISVVAISAVIANGEQVRDAFNRARGEVNFARLLATAERVIAFNNDDKFPAQDCLVGTSGPQSVSSGTEDGDEFDCYELGGGGDVLDIMASPPRNIAYYVANGGNIAALPSGSHAVIFPSGLSSGTDEISTSGSGIVDFPGLSDSDVSFASIGPDLMIANGAKRVRIIGHFASSGEDFTKFLFADGAMSPSEAYDRAINDQITPGSDVIEGSDRDDVIDGAGLGAFDDIRGRLGDDTIIYTPGSNFRITGGSTNNRGIGSDTLDMTGLARSDVSISTDFGFIMTVTDTITPGGGEVEILGFTGADAGVDEIRFSDQVLSKSDLESFL